MEASADIVLSDMRMFPVMNGLEATSLIREFNQITPIIALTANAFDSDRENALAAGCNHFMTKPVKKRELIGFYFSDISNNNPNNRIISDSIYVSL